MASFQGILTYGKADGQTQSFLEQTDASGQVHSTLIIKSLPPPATFAQQVAAATNQLATSCKLPGGTLVTINGTAIAIGNTPAIAMNSCAPCNSGP